MSPPRPTPARVAGWHKILGIFIVGASICAFLLAIGQHSDNRPARSSGAAVSERERAEIEKNVLDGSHQEYLKALGAKVTPSIARPTANRGVSMSAYERLVTGISYQQACTIIGFDGVEQSRSDLGRTTTVMYAWKGQWPKNMNAIFQNDELVSKAQFGLR